VAGETSGEVWLDAFEYGNGFGCDGVVTPEDIVGG
jgi:hypothetical protein